MNSPVRPEQLRELIVGELEGATTWHTLEGACRRLGLVPHDNWNGGGKAKYVHALLESHTLPELVDLAGKFVSEFGSERLEAQLDLLGPRGASGEFRNLIFAGTGPKPEIVLPDSVNNHMKITKNAEHWLFYDRPLTGQGLTWHHMIDWWPSTDDFGRRAIEVNVTDETAVGRALYKRLFASIPTSSPPAQQLFSTYCSRYGRTGGFDQPILIPEVHLHYDPYTRRQRGGPGALTRERMDFLLLLPNRVRIVIEVDGKHHYTDADGKPSPKAYAEMVAADRRLRLAGYEVYRFGGHELSQAGAESIVKDFFDRLLSHQDVPVREAGATAPGNAT
ncbi:hypothetical protein ACPEIF_20225 [Streptomyces sp. NPDC012600]|uniref:hypothetical protein n=1 Tax=Streptomyces sp. NPDC012600 TaxID=3415005 RepID=UPI003C303FD7